MRRLSYNVLVGVTTFAVVGLLSAYGVGGWRLALLCVLLLAIYLRPRGDALARRERRIERESDKVARMMTDTIEVISRAIQKMPPPKNTPPDLKLQHPLPMPTLQDSIEERQP
jgi:hypothetical protein